MSAMDWLGRSCLTLGKYCVTYQIVGYAGKQGRLGYAKKSPYSNGSSKGLDKGKGNCQDPKAECASREISARSDALA